MLHKETVESRTLDLIRMLMKDPQLSEFFMVGGTALSLQLGHRISIDIDLFIQKSFDAINLKQYMEDCYSITNAKAIKNGLLGFINEIKIDLIAHQYRLIHPIQEMDGIRMASLHDIGAMKLHAIIQNGSRYKDFVDMYFLLEHQPLDVFIQSYKEKYPEANTGIVKNALIYFEDIDHTVPVKLLKKTLTKEAIKARLKDAVVNPSKLYLHTEDK